LRPVWALCEFSLGIDLPDYVMEHPLIVKLSELANDVVSWTNVRSYLRYTLNCID
jgi:alpha-muurolene/germacrene-A/gamma-muurolene synthase